MMDCESAFKWVSRLKRTYQPVEGFGDKIDPKRVGGFNKILDTIVSHCGIVEGKSFLDLGCNFGFFCLELGKMGASAIGVDRDERRVEVARCLAKKNGLEDAAFLSEDIIEFVEDNLVAFDYVILLNVFHHILVQDEERGWAMLNKLVENSSGIFVMMRNSLRGWKLCDSKAEIPQAVLDVSNATNFVTYSAVHGRHIYFFWKA